MKKIISLIGILGFVSVANANLFNTKAPSAVKTNAVKLKSETSTSNNTQDAMQAAAQAYKKGDKVAAFSHLKTAAEQGNSAAAYNLSVAYSNGDGTMVNSQEAMKWLQKAANKGYPPAQYDLALYYLSNKQPEKAAPFMQKLADQGAPAAQFNYGMMLLRGDGMPVNQTLGKQYIEKAAAQQFPPALKVLSQLP